MLTQGTRITPLPGGGDGAPQLVRIAPGRLDGFVIKDNTVWWARAEPEVDWGGFGGKRFPLPGNRSEVAQAPISAVSAAPWEIDVFGVGLGRFAGKVLNWKYRGGRWVQELIDGPGRLVAGTVSAAARGQGVVDVFAVNNDGAIEWWSRTGNAAWSARPLLRIPGRAVRKHRPAVATLAPNRIDVFAVAQGAKGDTVWHWWCDDGVRFAGPELLPVTMPIADIPISAAWSPGATSNGLQAGMRLDVAAISDGSIAKPRYLLRWSQVVGPWAWTAAEMKDAHGFPPTQPAFVAESDYLGPAWLEATPPVIVPDGTRFTAVTVSALKNLFENQALTRDLVVWGDRSGSLLDRTGPSDRGISVTKGSAGAIDALVEVEDAVIHVFDGQPARPVHGWVSNIRLVSEDADNRTITWDGDLPRGVTHPIFTVDYTDHHVALTGNRTITIPKVAKLVEKIDRIRDPSSPDGYRYRTRTRDIPVTWARVSAKWRAYGAVAEWERVESLAFITGPSGTSGRIDFPRRA
jgi:hypothetical protein